MMDGDKNGSMKDGDALWSLICTHTDRHYSMLCITVADEIFFVLYYFILSSQVRILYDLFP